MYGNSKDRTFIKVETVLKGDDLGAVERLWHERRSMAIRGPLCQGLWRADHTRGSQSGKIRTGTMKLLLETWGGIAGKPQVPHSSFHKANTWRCRLSLSYLALRYLSRSGTAAVLAAEKNGCRPYELPPRGVGTGNHPSWGRSR